jgi:hypothetical protein
MADVKVDPPAPSLLDELKTPPKLYLLRKSFSFQRNGSFIALQAGSLLSRDKEGALIDDAIRLGAQLEPVDASKVTFCPHCHKAIVGR